MKTKHLYLNAVVAFAFSGLTHAQTGNCELFTITSINPDTLIFGDFQVSIQFSGNANELIGYPLITSVQNCNGDTVASGTLSWFGQLGQTEQEYPISVTGDISCGPLTVNFQYLDSQGNEVECPLSFNPSPVETCELLTITGLNPDSLNPNDFLVSVQYDGVENEFMGGPMITTLLNCNGEIVGTGNPFWFGQLGQTTQSYSITITGDISCGPLTAYFLYYNAVGGQVICPLIINQLPTGIIEHNANNRIACFPNPAQDFVTLQADVELIGTSFQIIDISGKTIETRILNAGQTELNLTFLKSGVYFLKMDNNKASNLKIIKL